MRRSRPETAPWHFVDIPINQTHLDMQRDCAKGDCVAGEIAVLRQKLQDPAVPPDQRREALMFLIHFIGDMHQPLHCWDDEDRGGNTVRVVFHDRPTNLHSVWDSGLLSRIPPEDQLFAELSAESAGHAKKWSKGTVTKWANESHRAVVKIVYGLLPKELAGTPIPLSEQYEAAADPLVKAQFEAGARLAAVLNATLR